MGLFIGILVIIIGLPILAMLSRQVGNSQLRQIGMAIWFVGAPALLALGGWLIYRSL
ncbi:hypothetical protein [Streptomyces sp. NPDC006333]|uniref:hypothetical protein n=1 Tax=Streptomyces sp. NPDC006333 TaxID=3156753 RepID=UPI0033BDA13F